MFPRVPSLIFFHHHHHHHDHYRLLLSTTTTTTTTTTTIDVEKWWTRISRRRRRRHRWIGIYPPHTHTKNSTRFGSFFFIETIVPFFFLMLFNHHHLKLRSLQKKSYASECWMYGSSMHTHTHTFVVDDVFNLIKNEKLATWDHYTKKEEEEEKTANERTN